MFQIAKWKVQNMDYKVLHLSLQVFHKKKRRLKTNNRWNIRHTKRSQKKLPNKAQRTRQKFCDTASCLGNCSMWVWLKTLSKKDKKWKKGHSVKIVDSNVQEMFRHDLSCGDFCCPGTYSFVVKQLGVMPNMTWYHCPGAYVLMVFSHWYYKKSSESEWSNG